MSPMRKARQPAEAAGADRKESAGASRFESLQARQFFGGGGETPLPHPGVESGMSPMREARQPAEAAGADRAESQTFPV